MSWDAVFAALLEHGPFAIVCGILFWKDWKRDEREQAREIRREAVEGERIAADKAMAVAMTRLAERIRQ
jgi:hypothetical protein